MDQAAVAAAQKKLADAEAELKAAQDAKEKAAAEQTNLESQLKADQAAANNARQQQQEEQ